HRRAATANAPELVRAAAFENEVPLCCCHLVIAGRCPDAPGEPAKGNPHASLVPTAIDGLGKDLTLPGAVNSSRSPRERVSSKVKRVIDRPSLLDGDSPVAPDWRKVEASIDEHVDPGLRRAAWMKIARHWMERLNTAFDGGFEVHEGP